MLSGTILFSRALDRVQFHTRRREEMPVITGNS